ncbi:hypothetical protein OE88DRAFT_1653204 [Heliocybe sulcata]|uniref:DUF3835 domain-containing protein n=1 Tax=Heliocybe sulcata TaxID=5364 RepID=A0A5C3NCY8_9AGAM|nr:hypothetical protein OE88DRAFT_1653204 [Heliocybe sulcata]
MSASGSTRNLDEGRGQVLHAFLNSLSSDQAGDGGKFTPDQVERLSSKLGEILGDIEEKSGERRNEKGEQVNEEGLPIIDINEPIQTANGLSTESIPSDEPELLPLWALGPAERERRRREQDRILDLLEAEEQREQERDAEKEQEQKGQELERRKESAKADLEKLKAARELQKKMGKALLRNMAESKEREEREKQRQAEEDARLLEEKKMSATLRPRKSVTFADKPDHNADESKRLTPALPAAELGYVSLAKLQPHGRGLPTAKELDSGIMKMNVVERIPAGPHSPPPFGKYAATSMASMNVDSDDESARGSPLPADSDEGDIIASDADEDSDGTEDEVMLDEEYDMNTVQHHREIALAYYEKRSTIGAEAKKAMTSHTHEGEHEWDQPEVPLEATLASPPPKPYISRFKSDRLNAYNLSNPESASPSTSLAASVIPASQTRNLQRAIRTGKMENGKLIGGQDGDSGSDIDAEENAREVLEMLKRGEVTNAGPEPETAAFSNLSLEDHISSINERAASQDERVEGSDPGTSPTKSRLQASRFKSAFLAAQTKSPATPTSGLMTPATPINNIERSSPKIPAISATIFERQAPSASRLPSNLGRKGASPDSPITRVSPDLSTVAPQPTRGSQPPGASDVTGDLADAVVDSPSFQSLSTPSRVMPAMTVESPSFPFSSSSHPAEPSPTIILEQVRESPGDAGSGSTEAPKKVSRFLAQRAGH